jgi:ubiquinone biosynthesis protein
MRLSSLIRFEKNARRLTDILGVLGKYGLADLLSGLPSRWIRRRLVSVDGQIIKGAPFEARVRMALSELGPTFIKFGQMLSTRGDLLSRELIHELEKLQETNIADSPAKVTQTIERELGSPIDTLFSRFDELPMASASIAQVHRAWLPDGREVVLKVQHADIQDRVRCDLDLLAALAELAQTHLQTLRPYQPVGLVREFRRTLFKELDFHAERRNLEQFRRQFVDTPHLLFPAAHPELCSRRVLTMDDVAGIHGTDLEGLRASGVDLAEFTRRAGLMYLDMIFRDGFYHADPHPGNFVLMAGGVLGVVDCGMVGRLDETYREDFEDFLMAVVRNDAAAITRGVFRLASTPPDLDESSLRVELTDLASDVTRQPLSHFDLTGTLERVVDIVHRFRIVLPPNASLLIKTLIMLEGTARRFQPSFNLAELIEEYRESSVRRRLLPARWARRAERTVREWDRLMTQLPSELTLLLDRMRAGTFEIHHVHRRLEATVNRLVVGLLTASLLLSSSLLLSQTARGGLHWGLVAVGAIGLAASVFLLVGLLREIHRTHDRDVE